MAWREWTIRMEQKYRDKYENQMMIFKSLRGNSTWKWKKQKTE